MGISKDRIRNVFLFTLVILSFILSYRLWTAGRNIGEEETATGTTRSSISYMSHNTSETFRPASIALHGQTAPETVLVGKTYPLMNLLDERFSLPNLDQVNDTQVISNENYYYMLQSGQWLEFIFDEGIPLGLLSPKFDSLSQDLANRFFDRIAINLNERDTVYFYSMDSNVLYDVTTLDETELDLDVFANSENINYISTIPVFLENKFIYLPTSRVTIPYKSYITDQLPNSIYISNFFPDTSLVDVRTTEDVTRYIDLMKEVSINQNTYTLEYLRQILDVGQLSPTNRFLRSFEQIERFENWSDTLILSSYDEDSHMVSFRREVDGIPVFSKQDYESVSEVKLVESGVTHLKIPIRFISTPISIPTQEDETTSKELISGTEVMQLINSTLTDETRATIENIKIGYTWQESEEDSQVVNFEPDWYILHNRTWSLLDNFLELHRGAAYGL